MLNENDYETLQKSLINSQRLFSKLNNVANQANELEYDESGLFYEEEEVLERHWLKLSSKIINALSDSLQTYSVELLKNKELETRELHIKLINEDIITKIVVNYSEDDALNISQIS